MPLPLLLALVIGGIAAIAILLHLLGFSRRLHFADDAAIRREWSRHFPDDTISATHVSDDGLSALVETDHGPGLVWAMGADSTAHRLANATITETANGLRFHLHDFGAPGLTVSLRPDTRALWRQKLDRIR